MKPEALTAWISLYTAVGVLALMCAIFAAIITSYELYAGSWRPPVDGLKNRALMIPRLWLHWQKRYFSGFPVIVGIAIYFAHYIGFQTIWDI